MVIEPCGVATTFWTFLFPLKRLLGSLLFISRHPSNGAGLLGTPPCLPAPADSPASGSEGPRYSAARSVSMMGGRSRNLECGPLVIQTCLSMPVLVRAWPGRHRAVENSLVPTDPQNRPAHGQDTEPRPCLTAQSDPALLFFILPVCPAHRRGLIIPYRNFPEDLSALLLTASTGRVRSYDFVASTVPTNPDSTGILPRS